MKDILILVEDDVQQSKRIQGAIEACFPEMQIDVIETESDFYTRIDESKSNAARPCVVVCDVQLPWGFPEPQRAHIPRKVEKGSFRRAGLRCWEQARKDEHWRGIPWIFYTVLDKESLDKQMLDDKKTSYVQKDSSFQPLVEAIRLHLPRRKKGMPPT